MFCPNCGNKIEDDAKFCENCGANINDNTNATDKVVNTITLPKKSKKKSIIIALVLAIILLIAAAVAYSAYEWVKEKRMSKEINSHSIYSDDESKPANITNPTVEITTQKVTTTPVTTTKTTTNATKEKSNDKTYSITFEADELIEEAGLQLNGHVGVAVLSNLTCSNGNANIETETIYIYDSLVRVEVTGAEAGEVVLGGTITTYGLDMYQGETVSYPVDSGVFLISKTVGEASEEKTIIELNTPVLKTNCYSLTGDGSCIEITWDEILNADGYYISYMVEYNGDATTITNKETKQSNNVWYEKGSSPIYVYNFSVKAYANINGKEVCSQWSDFVAVSNNDYVSQQVEENNLNMKGQINCHGGTVAGFTTDYVVNGGAVGKVRNSLGDKWHVTAKNACDNYGVTWYELWDSDDGDYYGWVDGTFIDFY